MDMYIFISMWLAFLVCNIDGLMFHLPGNGKKCLKEEIHKDVLVTGEYDISDAPNQKVNLRVNFEYFASF